MGGIVGGVGGEVEVGYDAEVWRGVDGRRVRVGFLEEVVEDLRGC